MYISFPEAWIHVPVLGDLHLSVAGNRAWGENRSI